MINILRLGLLLILLAVSSYYAVLHYRVLRIDHPITQDEPGYVELAAAGNPYTHDGVLACGNVYGPGYTLWARPFVALFSNPYIALRWASSCALFAMLGLLAWVLRRQGVGGIETAAALAIVYILNVSSNSLSACTDLLGAALYFSALMVSRRGTWPALLAGLALTALAALTKPYFAFAGVIVASHLALFGPPRKALAYLGVSALLAAIAVGVLQVVAPFYFLSTFLYHSTVAVRSVDFLLAQSCEFALLAGGVLVLAVLVRPVRRTWVLSFQRPVLSPAIDLWDWSTLLAAAVLLGSLGWHPGNYLVYYFHLLLAPLVIVALRRIPAWPRAGRWLLGANLLVLGWLRPPLPGDDNWSALAASVAAVRGPILADPLLEPFARSQPNVTLLMHGQSASIRHALEQLGPAAPAADAGIQHDFLELAEVQAARIRAREYAAIYLCYVNVGPGATWNYDQRHVLAALFASYQLAGATKIFPYATPYWERTSHGLYPQHVTRWEPKPLPVAHVAGLP